MRQRDITRPSRRGAFTLPELLVVVGLIALLIGLLLPALLGARRQAVAVQCASNMRQIALAMLQYINDNKGNFPPAMVSANHGDDVKTIDLTDPYPDGWFWAAELVNQHYLSAPNILLGSPPNSGVLHFSGPSVFQCPQGAPPDVQLPHDGTSTSDSGACPTDPKNSVGAYAMATNPRGDGKPPYAVATWYQVCCASTGKRFARSIFPGGPADAPFLYFAANKGPLGGPNGQLASRGYQRNLGDVRHSGLMCMLAEASIIDWMVGGKYRSNQLLPPVGGETMWLRCLAARHGKVSANHNNAYTNIAFFDGHVASFATQPLEDYVNSAGVGGGPVIPPSMGVVFTLDQDQ